MRDRQTLNAGKKEMYEEEEANKVQHDLSVLINKWQTKLKLNHWHIDYEMCDREKMGGEYHGRCRHTLKTLKAEILLMTEEEFDKGQKDVFIKEPYDLEDTVVHELLHILLCPLNGEEDADEQTVNILTRILIEQDRAFHAHLNGLEKSKRDRAQELMNAELT